MLQAPPPSQYDLVFYIRGIRVRVHPLFWLLAVFLGYSAGDPVSILIWVVAVFVSILIHELGHVIAMRRYGGDGSIVLYHFGGLAIPNRSYGTSHNEQIMISLAGPTAGFLFAALILMVAQAVGGFVSWGSPDSFFSIPSAYIYQAPDRVNELIWQLLWINIGWGMFNLLPVYPLDGGQVTRHVWVQLNPRNGAEYSLQLSIVVGTLAGLASYLYLDSIFMAFMFGSLAYQSYQLMSYGGYR
ncbi:MAG: site-2 protease family protein [Candidatus Promineifilaceae bacterium]